MKSLSAAVLLVLVCAFAAQSQETKNYLNESRAQYEARMVWWTQARFGMFIHWGLYSIPAGEWKGSTNHAEWIRTTAQIPLGEYDKFVGQFNPVKFNAAEWVKLAKNAGMKYITITSKHHDGFCLFDSKFTDFDVMSTPFKRDILKELADACHKEGIKICWYHSIMDWHHPDYLPRREWEKDRSTAGADYDRYVQHLKNQLKELLTNYGEISVLWFDGEWESTWNQKYGTEIYNYVRSLQPNIIINNRVGAGRAGMEGFTKAGEFAGDFGTPEQEIPATGMPGLYWETCMTMNNNWGYNKHDDHWKSPEDLIRKLSDIASKGGNFLLNVGPTSEGVFPQPSVDRLKAMGEWMKVNGEAIYSTKASPFKNLSWGRCTQKAIEGGVRLYLHVFDWPLDGRLVLPGILNQSKKAYLLSDPNHTSLAVSRNEDAIVLSVPSKAPDAINSIIVLDVEGKIDITSPPSISSKFDIFIDALDVSLRSDRENVAIRYTLDGSVPTMSSKLSNGPVTLTATTTVTARCFRDGKPVSGPVSATFTKVKPEPAMRVDGVVNGIQYSYYEGDWSVLPDFRKLKPIKSGSLADFDLSPRSQPEYFGFEYTGYIRVPEDGVYSLFIGSDDGSRLLLDNKVLIDNDGLHSMNEMKGVAALATGLHSLTVQYFQKSGGRDLKISVEGPKGAKEAIPASMLFRNK
jgi:alpha-L-fucosidase